MNNRRSNSSGQQQPTKTIRGRIIQIQHRNEETGFSVFKVEDALTKTAISCVGVVGPIQIMETANVEGIQGTHPKFGPQIKILGATVTPPENPSDIISYLSSGLIKGIGPETAKQIVKLFGADTLNVISERPDLLITVPTVGKKRAGIISAAWAVHRDVSAIMQFLSERKIGPQRAFSIYKAYRDEPGGAFRVMTENPYQLIQDVRGIGFSLADKIATTLGIGPNDIRRLRAGVNHVLQTETTKGNCGLPLTQFLETATELLGAEKNTVREVIRSELKANRLIHDQIDGTMCAFTRKMHEAEGVIAERLKHISRTPLPWRIANADAAITAAEISAGRTLAASQRNAISIALANKVSIITGGPGVGKTTTLDTLLRVISNHVHPDHIQLAAPTGRAAKRMSAQTGRPAMTVHRLIGAVGQPDGHDPDAETNDEAESSKKSNAAGDPFDKCRLLVIDESSMLDVRLLQTLLDRIYFRRTRENGNERRRYTPAIIMLGDVDQIPSVGAGAVLRDLINSHAVPIARLTEIFRQSKTSRIITNAHRINNGEMPTNEGGPNTDFWFWPFNQPRTDHGRETSLSQSLALEVVDQATNRIPKKFNLDPRTDIQILVPMRRGELGTTALNKAMQSALNPPRDDAPSYTWNDWCFRCTDKVMQTSNNYDKGVFNGDQGFVDSIDLTNKSLTVRYDETTVAYDFDELDQLMAAYAITIHKSQGSEYPAVIVPVVNAHYMMLAKNLVYTAITRGKQMVVLIGQTQAIQKAVKNNQANSRWTRLRQLMEDEKYQTYSPREETKLPSVYSNASGS